MGHHEEVVLARKERVPLFHPTTSRDPRGSHAQEVLAPYSCVKVAVNMAPESQPDDEMLGTSSSS